MEVVGEGEESVWTVKYTQSVEIEFWALQFYKTFKAKYKFQKTSLT
jgi:hypothetical protein